MKMQWISSPVVVLILIVTLAEANRDVEDILEQYTLLETDIWKVLFTHVDKEKNLMKIFVEHWKFIEDHKLYLGNVDNSNDFKEAWLFPDAKEYLRELAVEYEYEPYSRDLWYYYERLAEDIKIITDCYRHTWNVLNIFSKANSTEPPAEELRTIIIEELKHKLPNYFTGFRMSSGRLFNLTMIIAAKIKMCDEARSPQEFIQPLFNLISLSNLKYHMLMQLYIMISALQNGLYIISLKPERDEFKERSKFILEAKRNSLKSNLATTIWRCENERHEKGVDYEEITRLLQAFVENEVNLNDDGSCWNGCADYTSTKTFGCYDKERQLCSRQPICNGNLVNCTYFEGDMTICPADSNSARRYDHIKLPSNRVLGDRRLHENLDRGLITKRYSCREKLSYAAWWRSGFVDCNYCICLCDEQGPKSDRFFSLRASISDIQNNMIVTGLRFKKINRILHLQIQQGKLLPGGKIENSTLSWKEVDTLDISDENLVEGTDFHTLTFEKRAIDLDDVITNKTNHVVTGVRFRLFESHLNLQVHTTEFDIRNGTLYGETSGWISGNESKGRKQIKLIDPDQSSQKVWPRFEQSPDHSYVEFTHTDFDKDAAQTTVPFIDIQKVVPVQPVLLVGLGIYHRGKEGYGGFIAPKIFVRPLINK